MYILTRPLSSRLSEEPDSLHLVIVSPLLKVIVRCRVWSETTSGRPDST